MISKEQILSLGKLIGVDLAEAYDAAEEVSIDIPKVKVFTDEGLKRFESEKYNAGKTAGLEIGIKEFKEENGLNFKGKGLSDLVAHYEAQKDSDGRVKKLQENLTAAEKKAQEMEERYTQYEVETEMFKAIPAEYGGLTRNELAAIAKANGLTLKKEDGKYVPYRNGERVREERTQNDLTPQDAYKAFFEGEKKMSVAGAQPQGEPERKGRGGNGTPPKGGISTKRSEIEKAWKESNPDGNLNGMEYQSHFAAQVKALKEAGQAVEMD